MAKEGPTTGSGVGSPLSTAHQTGERCSFDSEEGQNVSELEGAAGSHFMEADHSEAADPAAADAAVQEAADGGDTNITIDKEMIKLVSELVSKRAWRRRSEDVGSMPAVLRSADLPLVFWAALDASSRHYIKRRIGKIKPKKLMQKAVGFVLYNMICDLERAGHDIPLNTLKDAVRRSDLLPLYFFDCYEQEWNELWVYRTPRDEAEAGAAEDAAAAC